MLWISSVANLACVCVCMCANMWHVGARGLCTCMHVCVCLCACTCVHAMQTCTCWCMHMHACAHCEDKVIPLLSCHLLCPVTTVSPAPSLASFNGGRGRPVLSDHILGRQPRTTGGPRQVWARAQVGLLGLGQAQEAGDGWGIR